MNDLVLQHSESEGIERTAWMAPCDRYRYALTRSWDTKIQDWVVFIMLNPSTADGLKDDATIRSCMRIAKCGGRTGIVVVNLFAWRSTDPAGLLTAEDPIGPCNDKVISSCTNRGMVIAAWGSHAKIKNLLRPRADAVVQLLSSRTSNPWHLLSTFGRNADGQPKHPLYLASTVQPRAWDYQL